jgi:hypothetical protein
MILNPQAKLDALNQENYNLFIEREKAESIYKAVIIDKLIELNQIRIDIIKNDHGIGCTMEHPCSDNFKKAYKIGGVR